MKIRPIIIGFLTLAAFFGAGSIVGASVSGQVVVPGIAELYKSQTPRPGADFDLPETLREFSAATDWVGSNPGTPEYLEGSVVIVYFWNSGCPQCIAALSELKNLKTKYGQHGLIVVAVHAPELESQKDAASVKRTADDLGINYPVAIDNDFELWETYHVRFWPTWYLYDLDGSLSEWNVGTFDSAALDASIRRMLSIEPEDLVKEAPFRYPGVFFGYKKKSYSNPGSERYAGEMKLVKNTAAIYAFPDKLPLRTWALDGGWLVSEVNIESTQTPSRARYHYFGSRVTLHADIPSGQINSLIIQLDGQPVPQAVAGKDILYQIDGRDSFVASHASNGVCELVSGPPEEHTIEISVFDPGIVLRSLVIEE